MYVAANHKTSQQQTLKPKIQMVGPYAFTNLKSPEGFPGKKTKFKGNTKLYVNKTVTAPSSGYFRLRLVATAISVHF